MKKILIKALKIVSKKHPNLEDTAFHLINLYAETGDKGYDNFYSQWRKGQKENRPAKEIAAELKKHLQEIHEKKPDWFAQMIPYVIENVIDFEKIADEELSILL